MGTPGAITKSPHAPKGRAGNGIRTRDINLGKVALYQLSYSRKRQEKYNQRAELKQAKKNLPLLSSRMR
jgi:hypothetical protein